MKYCGKCGHANNDNAVFCRACGERMSDDKVVDLEESSDPSESKHGIGLIVGVIVVVAVMVIALSCAVVLIRKGKGSEDSEDSGMNAQLRVETVQETEKETEETELDLFILKKPEKTAPVETEAADTSYLDSLDSETIEWIENALEEMNYDGVVVNQSISDDEKSAIYRFQANHGLAANGILDEATLYKIEEALEIWRNKKAEESKESVEGDRSLKYNPDDLMTGPDVEYVQSALIEMKYTDTYIEVNGIYDSYTEAAVKRFQKNHSLEVDGICGPITMAEIRTALEKWRKK